MQAINFFIVLLVIITSQKCVFGMPRSAESISEVVGMDTGIIDDLINYINKFRFNASYTGLDVNQHAKFLGYPIESYYITTEDNYILKLDRIPHGKNEITSNQDKPAVVLVPGLLCSSACFLDLELALGYLLADQGYDVWVPNVRGSTFSRNHTILDPKDEKFWEFSWHEIGYYDLPAVIDFALAKSKRDKINYIGHSQGTTSFFVMASERPEYNDKINVMMALAPVAYMKHAGNLMYRILAPAAKRLAKQCAKVNIYDIFPRAKILTDYILRHCSPGKSVNSCERSLFFQLDVSHIDLKNLTLIVQHYPGGAAIGQFVHYAQSLNTGKFKKFDFGKEKNEIIYNQPKPPAYDLQKITAPVYLIYGNVDTLGDKKDVMSLSKELPNVVEVLEVNDPDFNHDDFLYKKNVYDILYKDLIRLINKNNDL